MEKKKKLIDPIDIASDDSFPCSDPPGWIRVHASPCEDIEDEYKEKDIHDKKEANKKSDI